MLKLPIWPEANQQRRESNTKGTVETAINLLNLTKSGSVRLRLFFYFSLSLTASAICLCKFDLAKCLFFQGGEPSSRQLVPSTPMSDGSSRPVSPPPHPQSLSLTSQSPSPLGSLYAQGVLMLPFTCNATAKTRAHQNQNQSVLPPPIAPGFLVLPS